MPPRTLCLLAVGALRTPHWKAAADHYLERLRHLRPVQERVVKDADPRLRQTERVRREGDALLRAVNSGEYLICLDERGKSMNSQAFAAFLREVSENAVPCFVVGGAFGLAEELLAGAKCLLSLGSMTLPHELARVVLLEQLYRAETIVRKIPYHH